MSASVFPSEAERRAKQAENYPDAFGAVNLTHLREQVAEVLKLIGRDGIFREYTLHDMNHIDAMLLLVDRLVPPGTVDQLTAADWLMIVLSCYFHDLGLLVTKAEFEQRENGTDFPKFRADMLSGEKGKDYGAAIDDLSKEEQDEFLYQEFVRSHHPQRIAEWIKGEFGVKYGISHTAVDAVNALLGSLDPVFRSDLAMICRSHHEDDLYDFSKYRIRRVYGDRREAIANLHYAALMLRTADVLQIQRKRVPSILFRLIDPSNPKSQQEWAKQEGVRAVSIKPVTTGEPDTIEIHASFERENAYFGLLAYLQQYAGKELEKCWDWGRQAEREGSRYSYPWRRIDSTQVEPLGFEGKTYSFQLDQERILTLLTGHTLYNNPAVAIREIVQNAIDAVRFRYHTNPTEQMGVVEVHWKPSTRQLIVRDSGTGMTQEIIEKFLLNVGASFYQSDPVIQKHTSFSPISRFGIGVLSTFMIAAEVRILTVHPDEEHARLLTLPSVVKNYLVKKVPKGDPTVQALGAHATEVTLTIRNSAQIGNVEDLLRYWVVLPECSVVYREEDGEPKAIGFSGVQSALEFYSSEDLTQSLFARSEIRFLAEPGIDLAYTVIYSPTFDLWEFSSTDAYNNDSDDDEVVGGIKLPPGLCVEGKSSVVSLGI